MTLAAPVSPIRAEGESSLSSVHRLAGRPCWDVAVIGMATVRQELPVSPFVPSLPPHLVRLGFDYVLAVEAGDDVQAARLAPEVEQLPGLLPAIAELIVFPVTALSDDTVWAPLGGVGAEHGVSTPAGGLHSQWSGCRTPSVRTDHPHRVRHRPECWGCVLGG